jgi:hypothetical protein
VARVRELKRKELNKSIKNFIKKPESLCFPVFYFILCPEIKLYTTLAELYFTILFKMKKMCIAAFLLSVLLFSCARGITPYQAANGKAKCGRYLK